MRIYLLIFFFLGYQITKGQVLLGGMPNPNGAVYAIEKVDSTIYIGGFFSDVDGQTREAIARFDAKTGTLDSWNPSITNNGVTTIVPVADKLIVGGSFVQVNSQPRYGICMFDLPTGNLTAWSDTANVYSWRQGIGVYNNSFFYCKSFNWDDLRLVCVDALSGNYLPWQSDSLFTPASEINSILATGTYVYVGGKFSFKGGLSVYSNLCRFSQSTGALDLSWQPQPNIGNFGVTSIVKTDANIFVGGDFNTISGQSRKGVAAYDFSGILTGFNQNSSSYEVLSLFPEANHIWVGGNSYLLGGQSRYRIAQIRISNGSATCWNASATSNSWSTVQAIYVSGDTVYAGPFGTPRLSVFINSPLPHTSSQITGPASVLPSQMANYTVPFNSGNTYTWNVTGGTASSTTNSINVTWGSGPGGKLSVVENNPSFANCYSDTASIQVSISSTTTVDEPRFYNTEMISVSPNPSNGTFTIHYPEFSIEDVNNIHVVDVLGNQVLSMPITNPDQLLDLNNLANGIYFLRIVYKENILTKIVVKE